MPRTNVTVETGTRQAPLQDPTSHVPDAANGNSYDNSSTRVIMLITNGSGGNLTVTIPCPALVDTDLTTTSRVYTIPNGETWFIPPFPTSYNQTDNGLSNRVLINWSTATSVTFRLIQVPAA